MKENVEKVKKAKKMTMPLKLAKSILKVIKVSQLLIVSHKMRPVWLKVIRSC